jgi:hypothetical protein
VPDRAKAVESEKVNDKALFTVAMVIAAFLVAKGLYLETYGSVVDAVIVLALGFGVRAGLPVARWLLAMYAFVTPILVVANGGGGAVIWPFIFFYVCRSLLSQHNGRVVVDTDSHQNTPPLQPVATEDTDLALYKLAADELNSNSGARNEALWYKAFADASGDEQATKATYIRLRVEQLRRRADVATALTSADRTQSNTQAAQAVPPSSTQINFWVLGISVFLVIGIIAAIGISADKDMKKNLKVAQPSNPVPAVSRTSASEVTETAKTVEGANFAASSKCDSDQSCSSGLYCISGQCRQRGTARASCDRPIECAEGFECRAGHCEAEYKPPNLAKGARCATDGECASTLYCIFEACSEQAKTGQPCARNTDCTGDLRCNNGVCMKAKS